MIEYGRRTRNLPAPPSVVWTDLVRPRTSGARVWLALLDDEVAPRVLESEKPSRVVWSSLWLSRPDDRVVLELASDGRGGGTDLCIVLLASGEPPDARRTGHIRKRIIQLLYADLRFSYGQ